MASVIITPQIPPGSPVAFPMGDGPAKLSTPGGWATTARPRRTALTDWAGEDPTTMTLPILLDGFATDTPVEQSISILFGWLRVANGPNKMTPVVRVDGPVPLVGQLWVINGIEWGDELRRESDGQRVRQALTITFLEYVPGEATVHVSSSPAAAAATRAVAATSGGGSAAPATGGTTGTAPGPSATGRPASATPAAGTYTVRSGDTLALIAQRQLGNSSKWTIIADMNGIRDARTIRVGQVLKMPAGNAPPPAPWKPPVLTGVVLAGHGRIS